MKKLDVIQALRGICVFMVVFFHVHSQFNFQSFKLGDFLFHNGNSGVDIFFIISGFIMIYTAGAKSGAAASGRFVINRVSRIVPLYIIATAVFITILHPMTWWIDKANILTFIKDMVFLPRGVHEHPPFYGYPELFVGWSLRYEMFFYLIFGASLLLGRYKAAFMYSVFAILLIALPLATHQFRISTFAASPGYRPSILDMFTNPIIAEFLAGMLLGQLYMSSIQIPKYVLWGLLALGIGLFIPQYFFDLWPGHGLTGWGLFGILILSALVMLTKHIDIKVPSAMVLLGNISYSIYMWHTVVGVIFLLVTRHWHLPVFDASPIYLPFYLAGVIGLSYLSYTYIEQRLSNFIKFKVFALVGL